MATITVDLIKSLRDKTNAGMMDCKSALVEAEGNLEEAATILRKKGIANAEKKAGRTAKEGVIASRILEEEKTGILVEVNCETDFVAKNENFTVFVESLIDHLAKAEDAASLEESLAQPLAGDPSQTLDEYIKAKVGELGENMALSRYVKFRLAGEGLVASYIHLQGRVGVLVEVACSSADTASDAAFREFVKDLTLHIAAAQPLCISREDVPAEKIEAEKDIFREQLKDKPADMIEKIVGGKLGKFYSSNCLLEQAFIRDDSKSIQDLIDELAKSTGDKGIAVSRFARYAVGEEA